MILQNGVLLLQGAYGIAKLKHRFTETLQRLWLWCLTSGNQQAKSCRENGNGETGNWSEVGAAGKVPALTRAMGR